MMQGIKVNAMKLDKRKILLIMAEQGTNCTQCSEKIGATPSYYSQALRRCYVMPKTANNIAKGLGVNVSDIIILED